MKGKIKGGDTDMKKKAKSLKSATPPLSWLESKGDKKVLGGEKRRK
jgi:hypothetical protein